MCPFLCAILPFLILGYVNFLFSILYTIKMGYQNIEITKDDEGYHIKRFHLY